MASSLPPSWTLKIDHKGDIRRVSDWFWPADGAEPSVDSVKELACKLFSIEQDPSSLRLEYQGKEGICRELSSASFADALDAASDVRTLRVAISDDAPPKLVHQSRDAIDADSTSDQPKGEEDGVQSAERDEGGDRTLRDSVVGASRGYEIASQSTFLRYQILHQHA
jgi:hypothetical protein